MCSIHSISRYNDFVLELQDSSEVHSYQPVMNKVVSCKDSSGTIINDIHLLKLSFEWRQPLVAGGSYERIALFPPLGSTANNGHGGLQRIALLMPTAMS